MADNSAKLSLNRYSVIGFSMFIMLNISLDPFYTEFSFLEFLKRGDWYQYFLGVVGALFVVATERSKPMSTGKILIYAFYLVLFYMAYRGIDNPNVEKEYYRIDFLVYLRLAVFMHLGYCMSAYKEFLKAWLFVIKVGVVVSIIAILTQNTFVRNLLEKQSLAYLLQSLIMPSVFFIFFRSKLKKSDRNWVVVAFVLYAVEQILFQKRLPLARVFVTLGFLSFLRTEEIGDAEGYRKQRLNTIVNSILLIFLTSIMLTALGFNVLYYSSLLAERFFQEGDLVTTVESDTRWEIGDVFYEDLAETNETLSGRGLGGAVYNIKFNNPNSDSISGFRTLSEMAIPTILLKGGVFLLACVIIFIIIFLQKKRQFMLCPQTKAVYYFILIYLLFSYMEGFVCSLFPLSDTMIAYCMGMLLTPASAMPEESFFNLDSTPAPPQIEENVVSPVQSDILA